MFQQLLVNKHHRLRDSVPITIWPSGGLRLVTDIKKNNNKSRVKQEPRSAHGRAVNNNKSRVKQEPRSAHGRAVKKNDHLKGSGFQRRLDCKVRNLVTNSTGKRGPAFRLLFLICCKIYSQMVKDVY